MTVGLAVGAAGTLLLAGWAAVTVRAADARSVGRCSVSAWTAPYLTDVVVVPQDGVADIPVGTFVFGAWNTAVPACPVPTTGSLTVRVDVGPPDTGRYVNVGERTVSLDVTSPGRLLVAGRGGETVVVPIDLGELDAAAGLDARVTTIGALTFENGGRESALVTHESDALFTLGEPAPTAADQPRLRLQSLDREAPAIGRPGDQVVHHVLFVNDDLDAFALLDLSVSTRQVSGRPDTGDQRGFAVHGITPENGQAFPLAFVDDLDPLQLLSLADPPISATRTIQRRLLLAPGEARVVSVATRAFGSSPDGAACAVDFETSGRFGDGSGALANLTLLHVVDDAAATRTPLYEVEDTIGTADRVQTAWSALVVNEDPVLAAHCPGNDATRDDAAFVLNGAGLTLRDLDALEFPGASTAVVRTELPPHTLRFGGWHAAFGAPQDAPEIHRHRWLVTRLPLPGPDGFEIDLPAMLGGAESGLDFELDLVKHRLRTIEPVTGERIGQARIEDLRLISVAVPQGVAPDNTTRRRIVVRAPEGAVDLRPLAWYAGGPTADGMFVFDDTDGSESIQLTASSGDLGLNRASAAAGDLVLPTLTDVPAAPAPPRVEHVLAQISTSEGPRYQVALPVVGMVYPPLTEPVVVAPPPTTPKAKFKVLYKKPESPRDSLKLAFELPVPEGFDAQGAEVFVEVAGRVFRFVMEGNGRQQVPDPTASFRLKTKRSGGEVPAQNARATFQLRRVDLSGLLAGHGVWDATRGNVPARIPVRVLVRGEGVAFEGLFGVRSKRGKFAKGKLVR